MGGAYFAREQRLACALPHGYRAGVLEALGAVQFDHTVPLDQDDPIAGECANVENLASLCVTHHQAKPEKHWLPAITTMRGGPEGVAACDFRVECLEYGVIVRRHRESAPS